MNLLRQTKQIFSICTTVVSLFVARDLSAQISDKMVKDKIAQLQNRIIRTQQADGSWDNKTYTVGFTSLNLLALKYSEIPNSHPAVQKAVDFILNNNDGRVYSAGLVPCALELVSRTKYRARIRKAVTFLEDAQTQDGCWSYSGGNQRRSGDNSNAQFAVLGLAAAERCGVRVNANTKRKALSYWKKAQENSGGWGYTTAQNPRLSMTCAGIASLFLLGEELETPGEQCGTYKKNRRMKSALKEMSNLLAQGNRGGHADYTRYAIERVGIFMDIKKFNDIDWYTKGVQEILASRNATAHRASFQLLFLAKGFKGIAIAKWKWGKPGSKDWNNDHSDVQNWVKLGSKVLKAEMDYITDPLDDLNSPAAKASMIFVNGHDKFTATDEQLAFLRSFLEKGGTLVGEACCNSKVFAKSFTKVISNKLYPGTAFRPVSIDHELCYLKEKLTKKQLSAYQLKKGCKKHRVIVLTKDISCALNGEDVDKERSKKVAINILAWALKSKKADKKFDTTELDEVAVDDSLTADKVKVTKGDEGIIYSQPMGRLRHKGEFGSDPHFYDQLNAFLKTNPSLPNFDGQVIVSPESEDLFQMSVVFSTGHKDPKLTNKQLLNLRTYVASGGFLLSSTCCSEPAYDAGIKRAAKMMFKNDTLEEIPFTDPIYNSPFKLTAPFSLTKEGQKQYEVNPPRLYGIKRDNRWIMIHSPVDLCCALEEDIDNETPAYTKETAYKLITNIISYTFSAW